MDDPEILHLGRADAASLDRLRPGVFDHPIRPEWLAGFLADPGHEIVVAVVAGEVVAMATGTVLLHPDKPPSFFVNEVGVDGDFRRRGIGTRVMQRLLDVARARGCEGIWLGTEEENAPARALYRRLGGRESFGTVIYDWDGAVDD